MLRGTPIMLKISTDTPRVFYVETTWKRSFLRCFNVKYTWCVCRNHSSTINLLQKKSSHFQFTIFSLTATNNKTECAVKFDISSVFISMLGKFCTKTVQLQFCLKGEKIIKWRENNSKTSQMTR